jgi:hypothetical protein
MVGLASSALLGSLGGEHPSLLSSNPPAPRARSGTTSVITVTPAMPAPMAAAIRPVACMPQ